jgi:hypothetical protein
VIARNPMAGLRAPRPREKPVPVLGDADLRALIAACQGKTSPTDWASVYIHQPWTGSVADSSVRVVRPPRAPHPRALINWQALK